MVEDEVLCYGGKEIAGREVPLMYLLALMLSANSFYALVNRVLTIYVITDLRVRKARKTSASKPLGRLSTRNIQGALIRTRRI